MNNGAYLGDIIRRLNECLPEVQARASRDNIVLAADADVSYEGAAREPPVSGFAPPVSG